MQDQSFLNSLSNQFNSEQFSILDFLINVLITIILSYIIGMIYSKYGNSLSNRKKLSQTFVLIAMTVMLVISIVKSSLALSLGLVGALSIVRFRTAIKEPEELVYFFIAIGLGLGMGANQRIVTLCGVLVIILFIVLHNLNNARKSVSQNLTLSIASNKDNELDEKQIVELLRKHASMIELRRFDQLKDSTEISLNIQFNDLQNVLDAKNELKSLGDIEFNFIENY